LGTGVMNDVQSSVPKSRATLAVEGAVNRGHRLEGEPEVDSCTDSKMRMVQGLQESKGAMGAETESSKKVLRMHST